MEVFLFENFFVIKYSHPIPYSPSLNQWTIEIIHPIHNNNLLL